MYRRLITALLGRDCGRIILCSSSYCTFITYSCSNNMALITNVLLGFMALWCVIYFLVYVHFLTASVPADEPASNIILDNTPRVQIQNAPISVETLSASPRLYQNPILSYSCTSYIEQDVLHVSSRATVAVILTVTKENKEAVIRTATSIVINSGAIFAALYIIDDSISGGVKEWADWHSSTFSSSKLIHLRTRHRLGIGAARASAVAQIADSNIAYYVFADAHLLVTNDWLYPLVSTLKQHPKSLVYPAVDVLHEEPTRVGVIKGDKLVLGFDWSFQLKWIPLHSDHKDAMAEDDDDIDEALSPLTHSTFAIEASFFGDIGGYDGSLTGYLSQVELSLRVWLCGGQVIRQPCSRVAQHFTSMRSPEPLGASRYAYDKSVIAISHRWMIHKYREIVFEARFTDRLPEKVTIALDNLHPERFTSAKLINEYQCYSFDWYIKEIFPALLEDMSSVHDGFEAYISSTYLEQHLHPLLTQYTKSSTVTANADTLAKLNAYKEKYSDPSVIDPDTIEMKTRYIEEQHYTHELHVKTTKLCEDESFIGASCAAFKAKGGCESDAMYAMFGCPHSCGMCDANGKLCTDFYLKRCPEMKSRGKCETDRDYMMENCPMSCGLCTRGGVKPVSIHAATDSPVVITVVEKHDPPLDPIPQIPLPPADPTRFDPFIVRNRYLKGDLPDETAENPCLFNNRPHGDLLSRILLAKDAPTPRVFCGIYTMENNHATNTKATAETWAKHCDGFVAFSTKTDHAVGAMFIEHEGEESYQNMWQKSRSIWKYIAAHYVEDFDFFLLGGDDMFYIIENLKYYLASVEVQREVAKGKGVYIGRKFQPPNQKVFNSGGAGYILDKVSVKLLGEHLDTPSCYPHQVGFWEDVNVAHCLRVSNGIEPFDTRDGLKRERFHPFTPGQHLTYKIPPHTPDWYAQYNPDLLLGYDCCSDRSISFHYVPYTLMRQFYAYVYHCEQKIVRNNIYP